MADKANDAPRITPYLYYENVERALRWLATASKTSRATTGISRRRSRRSIPRIGGRLPERMRGHE
jgi:hypothetical protein